MKNLSVKRTRPIFIIIFICLSILFRSSSPSEFGQNLWIAQSLLLISFISIFIFKIKEEISIENGWLIFNLYKTNVKIDTSTIINVIPFDCWNEVLISTDDSEVKLNIQSFNSNKAEKFFVENELFKHVQINR